MASLLKSLAKDVVKQLSSSGKKLAAEAAEAGKELLRQSSEKAVAAGKDLLKSAAKEAELQLHQALSDKKRELAGAAKETFEELDACKLRSRIEGFADHNESVDHTREIQENVQALIARLLSATVHF